jgi:EmrB/QacA subfamily drug resistance transporter
MKTWGAIVVLGAAQFIMVLDTTVMNVAISDVVSDLNTTVASVQLAITLYTLVMAALMLTGGKLGDIIGRRRTFTIGLAIYGVGSLVTGLSPNIGVLLIGWSLLEGIGASLVMPAIVALVAANYEGARRALAFGIIGGVAAGGAAAGPLIGGAVTSAASWRLVFIGETVIIVGILTLTWMIKDLPREGARPRLDLVGAGLSALGMILVVYGILQSGTWGWLRPNNPPEIGGVELTPFGLSPVPFVIAAGVIVLAIFSRWEQRRLARGEEPIVDPGLLRIPGLRAGLSSIMVQQAFALGVLFVIPLYLQTVLGKSAFETGVQLLPFTISMLATSFTAPKLAAFISPRRLIQAGMIAMAIGGFGLVGTVSTDLDSTAFAAWLAVVGLGLGLLASQIGNVNMSSVDRSRSSEVGGLQGTAQNLGGSIGTALIGAILLGALLSSFQQDVAQNDAIPVDVREELAQATDQGIDFVPSATVQESLTSAGLKEATVVEVVNEYEDAQIVGLKIALLTAAALALLGLLFTRQLPTELLGKDSDPPMEGADPPAATNSGQ